MAASSGFSSSPVWTKFQTTLGKPIPQRCQDLDGLLNITSTRDLSAILPSLLENIFGFGPEPGWGLDLISKSQNAFEFEAVSRFLRADGTLLNLVYSLQTDAYLTYEFPFSCLPGPTRHMIEDGSFPIFYVNKLQYQGYSKPIVTLGAFELYMFYFCHALVSSAWQQKPLNWNSQNLLDVLYPALACDYLEFYLPVKKKGLPKFPQSSAASVRSPMMQQTPNRVSPNTGNQTRSRSRLGLLKASALSPQKPHGQGSPSNEKAEGEIWWSETFIQIVAEFWLGQNALDTERGISPQTVSRTWQSKHRSNPIMKFFESFMPNNNHVRLVRYVFKHVHSFVNSVEPEVIASPYSSLEASPLDEFKRSLIPSLLQKKIYTFLRHGFDSWPLDNSFRMILETWLTYIQPWRYKESAGSKSSIKEGDRVGDEWFPFVRDNFLFYTVIFQVFLQRLRRMQFTNLQNALCVYRVSKVFSLPNFPQLLREVERMMFSCGYKQLQDLGGSYIAPELNTFLRIQISDLERSDFHFVSFFGGETEREVQHLLQQILSDKKTVDVQPPEALKTRKSGFASFFDVSSLFEDSSKVYGDLSFSEVKKIVSFLDQAFNNYCTLFGLRSQDMSSLLDNQLVNQSMFHHGGAGDQSSMMNVSTLSTPGRTVSTPDCRHTGHGPELTPAGRHQLMNKLRKFDIGYQGDPDLQPIRSFENTTLVRVLYKLSAFINKMFENEISRLYSRRDLVGKMSQVYFAAPLSPSKVPTSPMRQDVYQSLRTPRLSLRFLGSYQTLLYLGTMFLFLRFMFGFGPLGYVMVLVLCVFVYGLFRALTLHDEVKVD